MRGTIESVLNNIRATEFYSSFIDSNRLDDRAVMYDLITVLFSKKCIRDNLSKDEKILEIDYGQGAITINSTEIRRKSPAFHIIDKLVEHIDDNMYTSISQRIIDDNFNKLYITKRKYPSNKELSNIVKKISKLNLIEVEQRPLLLIYGEIRVFYKIMRKGLWFQFECHKYNGDKFIIGDYDIENRRFEGRDIL